MMRVRCNCGFPAFRVRRSPVSSREGPGLGLRAPLLPVSRPRPLPSIADKVYMLHINTLDRVRSEWQSEHIKACEVSGSARAGLSPSTFVELLEGKLEMWTLRRGWKDWNVFLQTLSFCFLPILIVLSHSVNGLLRLGRSYEAAEIN